MAQQSSENLVWIDLEMTGLEVEEHVILQAALVITNAKLEPLEQFCCDVWQPESALSHMGPFVRDMHEKNGLITRVRASKRDVVDTEKNLLEIVARWCPYSATLCGNSIWSDRKFIDRYMPGLSGYLHYRMLDVSTIKVLASRWYGAEALFQKPPGAEHDALFDIQNSIAELKHYRATLFQA
jgi:oligoribonuclease